MKPYIVTAQVTISIHTEVWAATPEDAVELAGDRELIRLCHQCADSGTRAEDWVTSGKLDGSPRGLRAEASQ